MYGVVYEIPSHCEISDHLVLPSEYRLAVCHNMLKPVCEGMLPLSNISVQVTITHAVWEGLENSLHSADTE